MVTHTTEMNAKVCQRTYIATSGAAIPNPETMKSINITMDE